MRKLKYANQIWHTEHFWFSGINVIRLLVVVVVVLVIQSTLFWFFWDWVNLLRFSAVNHHNFREIASIRHVMLMQSMTASWQVNSPLWSKIRESGRFCLVKPAIFDQNARMMPHQGKALIRHAISRNCIDETCNPLSHRWQYHCNTIQPFGRKFEKAADFASWNSPFLTKTQEWCLIKENPW